MKDEEEKAARKAKKTEMKREAATLGISYDELKTRNKAEGKKREASSLSTDEHTQDMKRMRTWSKDMTTEGDAKRRTRSMDVAEEKMPAALTPEEWRTEHSIIIQGHGTSKDVQIPAPFFQFSEAPFSSAIQQSIKTVGFATPTHIQSQAWPIAIEGKDMICIAKTGSGKTCGFLLPSFHQHLQSRAGVGKGANVSKDPVMLVLAPTRELAVQIQEEAQRFGRPIGIRTICTFGGSPKYPQIAALARGVECVIATPGRLNDLLEMRKANLNNIKFVVLDEADRMLVSDI